MPTTTIRTCTECSTEYTVNSPRQKYCSRTCSSRAMHKREARHQRTCQRCGTTFQGRKTYRYCSNACAARAAGEQGDIRRRELAHAKGTLICRGCGQPFTPNDVNAICCSAKCTARSHHLVKRYERRTDAPAHELVHPRDIFARDGHTCQLCGELVDLDLEHPNPRSLSFDHIVPVARGGAHTLENLQVSHLRCNMKKGSRAQYTG